VILQRAAKKTKGIRARGKKVAVPKGKIDRVKDKHMVQRRKNPVHSKKESQGWGPGSLGKGGKRNKCQCWFNDQRVRGLPTDKAGKKLKASVMGGVK